MDAELIKHLLELFCNKILNNTTFVTLNVGNNPIMDFGASKLAEVLSTHPSLQNIDLEYCDLTDEGGNALIKSFQKSSSIRNVSFKNNLLRNGMLIQKLVSENPNILSLNLEFNDIDFKNLQEIQRILILNKKNYRESQKKLDDQAADKHNACEKQLSQVRKNIKEEREEIASLEKTLEELEKELVDSKESKLNNIAKLQGDYSKIQDEVEELVNNGRAEIDSLRQVCNDLEGKVNLTRQKNSQEIDSNNREGKYLQNLEQKVSDSKAQYLKEMNDLEKLYHEAVLAYKEGRQILTSSFRTVKRDEQLKLEKSLQKDEVVVPDAKGKKGKKGKKK